jgi:hypothetical protein
MQGFCMRYIMLDAILLGDGSIVKAELLNSDVIAITRS